MCSLEMVDTQLMKRSFSAKSIFRQTCLVDEIAQVNSMNLLKHYEMFQRLGLVAGRYADAARIKNQ